MEKSGSWTSGSSINTRRLDCEMMNKKGAAWGSPAVLCLTVGFKAQRKRYEVVLAFIFCLM